MPLGLATFVPESFALGQLVRFQQDVPCSADSEVQAPRPVAFPQQWVLRCV